MDRLHRSVRRRRAGLPRADGRGHPQAADVLSRQRAPSPALGVRQPGLRLVSRRQRGALSLRPLRVRPDRDPALPAAGGRRPGQTVTDARVRRRRSVARRYQGRLLAAGARFPLLEALRRRLGSRALRLRHRVARSRASDRPSTRRPRPDVDRRQDLLHVRSRRPQQPVRLRHADPGHRAAHRAQSVGRALAGRRWRGSHRLRAQRRAAGVRHRHGYVAGAVHRRAGRWVMEAPGAHRGRRPHQWLRSEPEGRARALRRPGRHLHGADREGPDPQSDP